jgi:hypothetical protein
MQLIFNTRAELVEVFTLQFNTRAELVEVFNIFHFLTSC